MRLVEALKEEEKEGNKKGGKSEVEGKKKRKNDKSEGKEAKRRKVKADPEE